MAPEKEVPSNSLAVHPVNSFEEEGILAFRGLIDSVRALSSQEDYKLVDSYFDEIERLRRELGDKEKGFEAYETLTANLAKDKLSLREQLEERDERIAQLSEEKLDLEERVKKLEEDSKKLKVATEKAKGKVEEHKDDLKAKDEQIHELEVKFKQAHDRALRFEEDLDSLKTKNNSLVRRYDATTNRLEELESFAVPLHNDDSNVVASDMRDLWKNAKEFVVLYFKENLPEISLQNDSAWARLIDPDFISHYVPLPQTNSIYAKQMRIAVILAILARSLDTYIFHPTYAFGEESGVREVLCYLAVCDSKKESFCRGLLLSLFPDEQDKKADERIDNATEYVMRHVQGLLPSPENEEFEAGLRQLARSAYETWTKIRTTKERYEPSFDVTQAEGSEWDTLVFDADVVDSMDQRTAIQGGRDDEILFILPRLYMIEKNQEPRLIADGTVLRRSQSLAAVQEAEGHQMAPQANLTFRRTASNRTKSRRTGNLSGSWNGNRSLENQHFLE